MGSPRGKVSGQEKGRAKVFLSFLSLPGVVSLAVVIFPCWGQLLSDIPFFMFLVPT